MLGWRPSRGFMEALLAYSLTIVLCVVTLVKLGLWTNDLTVPLSYHDGDDVMTQTWIKKVLESGSYLHNDQLGAPFGQDMQDFPMGDYLHYGVMKVLGILVSNNSSVVFNLYFLLSFPLTAVSSLWVCRRLGISWGPGILSSLLYAFLPYHFMRGLAHIFLAAYYMLPPLVLMALRIMDDKLWFVRRDEATHKLTWMASRKLWLGTALACMMLGASGVYYAFFSCFFLLVAGIWSACERRKVYPLLTAAGGVAVISLVLGLILSPSLFYTLRQGRNPDPMVRSIADCEVFGLRIGHLFAPPPGHPLGSIISGPLVNIECFNYQGVIGGIGLLILIACLFRVRSRENPLHNLSVLNGACLLLGTTNGLGWVFNMLVTNKIRCYGRLGVFVAFFSLVAIALLLDRLIKSVEAARDTGSVQQPSKYWIRGGILASLCVLTVIGLQDLLAIPGIFGGYLGSDACRQRFHSDARFFREIEQSVPRGAMVFQLPVASFPETPVMHGFLPYGHLAGYLHTNHLQWSHGAMKGRFGERWQRWLEQRQLPDMIRDLAFVGFSGIEVDRRAYVDGGASLETELRATLGVDALVSPDRQKAFYRMGAFTEKLRRRYDATEWSQLEAAARYPIIVHWKRGFSIPEVNPDGHFRWCDSNGELQLENGMDHPQSVELHWTYVPALPTQAPLHIISPLLNDGQMTIAKAREDCRWKLTIPSGIHTLRFSTQAPSIRPAGDLRQLVFRVQNLRVASTAGNVPQTAQKAADSLLKR